MPDLPSFVVRGERARLFPVLADTSKEGRTLSILLACIENVDGMLHPLTPATVQEIQAREAASAQYAAQKKATQKATHDRYVALCQQKALCAEFGTARQECATAADFNNCMIVKMGDHDWGLITYCANDGSVVDPPPDLPGDLICFGYAHGL